MEANEELRKSATIDGPYVEIPLEKVKDFIKTENSASLTLCFPQRIAETFITMQIKARE